MLGSNLFHSLTVIAQVFFDGNWVFIIIATYYHVIYSNNDQVLGKRMELVD